MARVPKQFKSRLVTGLAHKIINWDIIPSNIISYNGLGHDSQLVEFSSPTGRENKTVKKPDFPYLRADSALAFYPCSLDHGN